MSARPASSWFGYLDDVTSFYENGPAFSGNGTHAEEIFPLATLL